MEVADALMTLEEKHNRILRVLAVAPKDPDSVVEVLLDEQPMRREMWDYGMPRARSLHHHLAAHRRAALCQPALAAGDAAAPAHRRDDALPRGSRRCRPRHRAVAAQRRDRPGAARTRGDAGDGAPGAQAEGASRRARHGGDQDQPRPPQHPLDRAAHVGQPRRQRRARSAAGDAQSPRRDRPGGGAVHAHAHLHPRGRAALPPLALRARRSHRGVGRCSRRSPARTA